MADAEAATPRPEHEAPALTRPPEGLAGTILGLHVPLEARQRGGKLPFKAAEDVPEAQRAKRTQRVPVMRVGMGEAVPLPDDAITRTVAALPFLGNTVGTGIVPLPRLALAQHASSCVELAVWPDESPRILLRYHVVSRAGHEALGAHWQERLDASPEAQAAFERAFAPYAAWLRTA